MLAESTSQEKRRSNIIVGGIGAGAAAVVQCTVGLIGAAVIARWVGPEGKGAFDLCFATASLLGLVVGYSLPSGILYVVAVGASSPLRLRRQLIFVTFTQAAIAAVLLSIVSATPLRQFFLPNGNQTQSVVLVSLLVLALLFAAIYRAFIMGQKQFLRASSIDVVKQIIWIILVALFLLFAAKIGTQEKYRFAVAANICASSVAALIAFLSIMPNSGSGGQGNLRNAFAYAAPCCLANLVQVINYRLDAFIVNGIVGIGALGVYQLAATISQGIGLIPGTIASLILPTVASSQQDAGDVALYTVRAARIAAVAVFFVSIAVGLAGFWLIPLFFGNAFHQSARILTILLIANVAGVYTSIFAGYIAGVGLPQRNLLVSAISAACSVALQLTLVPSFGLLGAATGSLISAVISAVLTCTILLRQTRLSPLLLLPNWAEDVGVLKQVVVTMFGRVPFRNRLV